mmetsp:Transcript_41691/g.66112  ORF Transcript_41691/g.66112 Transcript_41691/m.66112 type:complete len:218 (+) Transcript_41691:229-882(+)
MPAVRPVRRNVLAERHICLLLLSQAVPGNQPLSHPSPAGSPHACRPGLPHDAAGRRTPPEALPPAPPRPLAAHSLDVPRSQWHLQVEHTMEEPESCRWPSTALRCDGHFARVLARPVLPSPSSRCFVARRQPVPQANQAVAVVLLSSAPTLVAIVLAPLSARRQSCCVPPATRSLPAPKCHPHHAPGHPCELPAVRGSCPSAAPAPPCPRRSASAVP